MKKILLVALLTALVGSAVVSQEKSWSKWSKQEADKILNHSPWGQTQTDTDTSEMVYTPTTQSGLGGSTRSEVIRGTQTDRQTVNNNRASQGATNQAMSVNYHVRLLSAKPVRQAFMRMIELTEKDPDQDLLAGLKAFVDRDFNKFIVVSVTLDSTDARFSAPSQQAFASATVGTLKNKTYLERKDGKRIFLLEYHPPQADGLGAKFIFPRMVDEAKFLNKDSGSVRFYSEITSQLKLNVTYKMSELVYNGELEY
jgi:hypothetical protein